MNCHGSVAFMGDSGDSNEAAMLGTAAHHLSETIISERGNDAQEYAGQCIRVHIASKLPTEFVNLDDPEELGWRYFTVDERMIDGVQMMVDEFWRLMDTMYEPEVYTERFLDMSFIDPRCGGTADLTLVEPFGWAHLLDYKNGYVLVDHRDNDQLKNYGVGILHLHPDVEGVRITIVQPNSYHDEGSVRTVEYTRAQLKEYEEEIRKAAVETLNPNAARRAGYWCTYCPGAGTACREFDNFVQREAKLDFQADIDSFRVDEEFEGVDLATKAKWIPLFDVWVKNVRAAVQGNLLAGIPVGDNKLVRAKSKRKFRFTEDEVIDACIMGIAVPIEDGDAVELPGIGDVNPDNFFEKKFKTPSKVEKLGKTTADRKTLKALMKHLAFMPEGRIVVADGDDPRPAIDPKQITKDEFAEDLEQEKDFD
jgi:hypothetical protein